jgi:hypothetical protein
VVRDCRASFWGEAVVCQQCGAPLRWRQGVVGYVLHTALMFGLAASVYLATRPIPDLSAVAAFLLLFMPAGVGVTALVQCYRWRYADAAPSGVVAPGGRERA